MLLLSRRQDKNKTNGWSQENFFDDTDLPLSALYAKRLHADRPLLAILQASGKIKSALDVFLRNLTQVLSVNLSVGLRQRCSAESESERATFV
jgi:hypothetical protein